MSKTKISSSAAESSLKKTAQRQSNLELFRIITMMIIVAHHYVVTSGLLDLITQNGLTKPASLFLLLFGWGGKTGINCFVMISGYFMCSSSINLKKFLKLLLEFEFYKIVIYLVFLITGYSEFSLKSAVKTVLPVVRLGDNFTNCYLVFFLFIPFLNILIKGMNEKMHRYLIALCLFAMTLLPTLGLEVRFSYVSWFMVIYFIGAYIRLYPNKYFDNKKLCGAAALLSLAASWASVAGGAWVSEKYGKAIWFHFVEDANKILAVTTSIAAFLFFKNLKMGYSKFINTVAASTFGVLLIHSGGSTMRAWLWGDVCRNTSFYDSKFLVLHAFGSVIIIYAVCTLIDYLRIKFPEKMFFNIYDKYSEKFLSRKK